MRIGLDFDRVLFDTDAFDEYYKDQTGLYHVEENVYDRNGNYDPEKHAKVCGIDSEKVWNSLEDLEQFLYEDIEVLDELDNHNLVIVTRGNEKFQRAKVNASGALKFVDDVVIVEKGSKDVADVDLLVDDLEEELENSEAEGVHLKRPEEGLKKIIEKVKELEA